jgi:hypothetical protein
MGLGSWSDTRSRAPITIRSAVQKFVVPLFHECEPTSYRKAEYAFQKFPHHPPST